MMTSPFIMSPLVFISVSLRPAASAANAPSPSETKPVTSGLAPSPPRRPMIPRVGAEPPIDFPSLPLMRIVTQSVYPSSPLTFSTVTSTLPLSLKRFVTVVPLAAGVSSRSNSSITCLNNMVNCLLRYKMIYGIFAHYIQFIAKCDMGQ